MNRAHHRLSLFQKKTRSFVKRFLPGFVNSSDSYILQHLPESIGKSLYRFSFLRSIWTHANEKNNNVDLVRLLFLQQTIEELLEHDIGGAFAEVGVYKGNSAKLFHELAPQRELYLFDTFQGFDRKDLSVDPKKTIHKASFLDTCLEEVQKFVGTSPNVHYCPGYFPDTTSHVPVELKFALVHLDADLYQPTLSGLEYFYPRLSNGGVMVIHDYSSGAWPGVKKAVDEFLRQHPEKLIRIPDKSGTVAFRRCFSVSGDM